MSVESILGLDPDLYPLLSVKQDGIVIIDPELRILFVSDSFLRMTGRAREDYILKKPPFPHWPPEMKDQYLSSWWDDWESDEPHEALLMRRDGERFRARVHSYTIRSAAGNTLAYLVAFQDLEGKNREIADSLETQWRQLRLVADSVPLLLSYVGNDFRYRYNNEEHSRRLGYDTEEIVGMHVSEVLQEKSWAIAEPHLKRAMSGEVVEFCGEAIDVSGEPIVAQVRATPDRDPDGNVRGVFISAFDVTQAARARAESRLAARILTLMNRAVRRLYDGDGRVEVIHEAFSEVAALIGADRFCLCRASKLESGGYSVTKQRTWGASNECDATTPSIDFEPSSGILKSLLARESVQRRRSEATDEDSAAVFEKTDARSYIAIPIFCDDEFWGLLKYDDLHKERVWSESAANALELASQTVGAALRDREYQEEIRRITRRYRDLTDNAPFCIHELDLDGRVRAISEWGYCVLGFRKEDEAIGLGLDELVYEADRRLYREMLDKAVAGEYCAFEFRLETPEGPAECETTMIPIRDGNGVVTHIMGTTADISARKSAERDAAVMRQRLERAEAASNVMRCFVHIDSRWKQVPDRLCDLLGYTREEMLRMTCAEMTHPEDLICEKKLKQAVFDHEAESFELEKRLIRKDGEQVWVYLSGTIVRDEDGGEDQWLAYVRDISEEKAAQQALRKSKRELRALAKRLQTVREEDFTRISREVHDELGQSLTALKMDLGWIERRIGSGEGAGDVRERLARMYDMIDRTIGHVREISGSLRPPILDDLGIAGALEHLVTEFSQHTKCRYAPGRELETLCATRDQSTAVYRIVQEVLTNIARHAEAEEVDIAVKRADDGSLVITIRDDGVGFDESKLTQNEMLGIVGMRERALVFGGSVHFEAADGRGTRVTIRIPDDRRESIA